MKRKPAGFTATCQCGVMVGALDAKRTDRADMGKLLGQWLFHGCTVTPFFGDTNCFSIGVCRCTKEQPHDSE